MLLEHTAPRFAILLIKAGGAYGAPIFAHDLAHGGAKPEHITMMAEAWEDGEFKPAEFAHELHEFARDLTDLESRLIPEEG